MNQRTIMIKRQWAPVSPQRQDPAVVLPHDFTTEPSLVNHPEPERYMFWQRI